MFIPKNYVLSNEMADKGNIHIANFSILYNKLEENNKLEGTMLKYGNSTFVNTKSPSLPAYIKDLCKNHKYTDLSDCVLKTYMVTECNLNANSLLYALSDYNPKITKVSNKEFIKFDKKFVNMLQNKVLNVLTREDTLDCEKEGYIDGKIQLQKNKYLTWYSVL